MEPAAPQMPTEAPAFLRRRTVLSRVCIYIYIYITPSSHHNIFPHTTFSKGRVAQKPLFEK